MADTEFRKKSEDAYEKATALLAQGELKRAEEAFEKAKDYLDDPENGQRDAATSRKIEELRGWLYFVKGRRAMEFASEAEKMENAPVSVSSYRKAYSYFFQALEAFSSAEYYDATDRARGYMNMANGLAYSSEGDQAFDNDEYTKSVEFYQKALSYLDLALGAFRNSGDEDNAKEVERMLAQTNADVWISEGHYNILLSKGTGEDELLARAEYERTAAEAFRKSVEYLEKMDDEELVKRATPSVGFADALHEISISRHKTRLAEKRLDDGDYQTSIGFFSEASEHLLQARRLYEEMEGFIPEETRQEQLEHIVNETKNNESMMAMAQGFEHLWNGKLEESYKAFSEAADGFRELGMDDQRFRCLKYMKMTRVWDDEHLDRDGITAIAFSSMQSGHTKMSMANGIQSEAEEDWNEANVFKEVSKLVRSGVKNGEETERFDMLSRQNREKAAAGFDSAKNIYKKAAREFSDAQRLFRRIGDEMDREAEEGKMSAFALSHLAQAQYFLKRAELEGDNLLASREYLDKAHEMVKTARSLVRNVDTWVAERVKGQESVVEWTRNFVISTQSFNYARTMEERGDFQAAFEAYSEASSRIQGSIDLIGANDSELPIPLEVAQHIRVTATMYAAFAHKARALLFEQEAMSRREQGKTALEAKALRSAAEEYQQAADFIAKAAQLSGDDELESASEEAYEKYLKTNSRANLLEGRTGVY